MNILGVDCGLRGCGCAVVDERTKKLVRAGYVHNTAKTGTGARVWLEMACAIADWPLGVYDKLAIETQQYRPGDEGYKVQNILEIQGVAGAITGLWNDSSMVTSYLPSEWKGTAPKDVVNDRVLAMLTKAELAVIRKESKALDHNTYDAIGIAFYAAKRMGRGGVGR